MFHEDIHPLVSTRQDQHTCLRVLAANAQKKDKSNFIPCYLTYALSRDPLTQHVHRLQGRRSSGAVHVQVIRRLWRTKEELPGDTVYVLCLLPTLYKNAVPTRSTHLQPETMEKAEIEPMEKVTLERVAHLKDSDYDQFGFPLEPKEDYSLHTFPPPKGPYEQMLGNFHVKVDRFNTLLKRWKTMPDYDPELEVDLPWLEERLGPEKKKMKREEVTEVDDDFYDECAKGFFKRMRRFNELMEQWKAMPDYDPEVKVTLDWLEDHVAPRLANKREAPRPFPACPFHPLVPLKILNPESVDEPYYYSCNDCPVWCTSNTVATVLPELENHTHPEVRAKLEELTCRCDLKPRMKLSHSEKNPDKVYLTCGQNPREKERCGYFQWMHGPLWRPKRPHQPFTQSLHQTLDQAGPPPPKKVKPTPVGDYMVHEKHPFAGGFKPPVFGETPQPLKKKNEKLCDDPLYRPHRDNEFQHIWLLRD